MEYCQRQTYEFVCIFMSKRISFSTLPFLWKFDFECEKTKFWCVQLSFRYNFCQWISTDCRSENRLNVFVIAEWAIKTGACRGRCIERSATSKFQSRTSRSDKLSTSSIIFIFLEHCFPCCDIFAAFYKDNRLQVIFFVVRCIRVNITERRN